MPLVQNVACSLPPYLAQYLVFKGCHGSKELVCVNLPSHYEAEIVRTVERPVVAAHLGRGGGGGGGGGALRVHGGGGGGVEVFTFSFEQLVRRFSKRPPVSD